MAKQQSTPSRESFDEWRNGPVGEWFFGLFNGAIANVKQGWADKSFDEGFNDPIFLAQCRAKAKAFQEIAASTYDDLTGGDDAR